MKKIFAALCLIPSCLFGVVFESDQMKDILPQVEEGTWVLLDVDNTLIEASTQLGSAQWRDHIRSKARAVGYDKQGVERVLDLFWLFVQPFIRVQLVDKEALQTIEMLQKNNTVVLALTAREPIELRHTQAQLHAAGISLDQPLFQEAAKLPSPHPSLFKDGVIYCGDNTKSEALVAFFNHFGTTPKKVIFVDDKSEQVVALEKTLEATGIAFVGIRFSAADKRVKNFDPRIADFQFTLLPLPVSDEEAKQFLSKRSLPS